MVRCSTSKCRELEAPPNDVVRERLGESDLLRCRPRVGCYPKQPLAIPDRRADVGDIVRVDDEWDWDERAHG